MDDYRPEFEKAVDFLRRELQGIRTGRATPALVEDLPVEAYGSTMTVKQVATITASDARTLLIEPWDKSVIKDIERGIRAGQTTLNPVVDGSSLRIQMPQLTEESRNELVKLVAKRVEEAKQRIRHVRDKARSAIVDAEREKLVTEDDRYRLQKQLDEMSEEYTGKLKELAERKEKEITTV